jgi:serine/threonine protein kinase
VAEPVEADDPQSERDDDVPVLQPGDLIAPAYRVVRHMSRGDALDVYEVFSSERLCSCIAKTVRPDRANVDRVRSRLLLEGRLLESIRHPHLLRGFETIEVPVTVVIVETMTGLSLEELLDLRSRRLPVSDLCHLGRQLCSATQYLHACGYLHLDIRPANVIVRGGVTTLIDLSLARPPGPIRRGLGTRQYLSPEQARGGEVTSKSDVWGLGATLYEATTDISAFSAQDVGEDEFVAIHRYLQLKRPAPRLSTLRQRLPHRFTAVVEACLEPDPDSRPTVVELWSELGEVLSSIAPSPVLLASQGRILTEADDQ